MEGVNFVANLRPRTIDSFAEAQLQPSAYLLSTHRISSTTRHFARQIRAQGLPLFADNGSKDVFDQVIERHEPAAREIRKAFQKIRSELHRSPVGSDIPDSLRKQASNLAWAVVDECTRLSEAIDSQALLALQLSIDPTHLIAQEDFSVTCLIALGLERERTGWSISNFDTRNRRSLGLFQQVAADPRCHGIKVYAVLGAMDYNTARSAGELAAATGAQHVAVGVASILRDPSAVDFFLFGHGLNRLSEAAPRRYVRLSQVARGIADGYRRAGRPLLSFHALGLGAATLLPALGAAFSPETDLTVDATSPIYDAVRDRVLYDPLLDADRISLEQIVNRIVQGPDRDWPFVCPFCQSFRDQFGHSAQAARQWFAAQDIPRVEDSQLRQAGPLADAIPLFAGPDGPVATQAQAVHVAHNHFVLDQAADQTLEGPRRRERSLARLDDLEQRESLVTARGVRAARQVIVHRTSQGNPP